jgi:hypothetical protein
MSAFRQVLAFTAAKRIPERKIKHPWQSVKCDHNFEQVAPDSRKKEQAAFAVVMTIRGRRDCEGEPCSWRFAMPV